MPLLTRLAMVYTWVATRCLFVQLTGYTLATVEGISALSMSFALRGTFVHAPDFGTVEVLQDTVCIVSGRRCGGKILALCPATPAEEAIQALGLQINIHKIPVLHLERLPCSCPCAYFKRHTALSLSLTLTAIEPRSFAH